MSAALMAKTLDGQLINSARHLAGIECFAFPFGLLISFRECPANNHLMSTCRADVFDNVCVNMLTVGEIAGCHHRLGISLSK